MTIAKIRVAYIITPITFGGAEKVSLNFLRTVNRSKFDIKLILLIRPWEEEPYFCRELRHLGYNYNTVPVALNTDSDLMRIPRVCYRLFSHLKKGAYDLVHTHGYFADICGQPVAFLLGIKGISTCHGFIGTDLKLRLYNQMDKIVLRLCMMVIAVSEMIKAELIRNGYQESKISVIPNAVSSSCSQYEFVSRRHNKRLQLHIAPDEHVVGYLGRISEEKGLAFLLDAIAELLTVGVQIRLIIVGEGPEREPLEHKVKAKGLTSKVIFVGFQTDPENWYPAFDVFALPSLTEGTPLALLESMAAGVPVVASAVGGVPNIVNDGINGLLVPPGAPLAISEKIQCLITDNILSLRLGKEGKETVLAKFNLADWCRRIENCYTGSVTNISSADS